MRDDPTPILEVLRGRRASWLKVGRKWTAVEPPSGLSEDSAFVALWKACFQIRGNEFGDGGRWGRRHFSNTGCANQSAAGNVKESMRKNLPLLCLLLAVSAVAFSEAAEPSEPPFYTLKIGDRLPQVDFVLADGSRIQRDDLLGRFVVIDFWATWCAPCIAAFPKLNKLDRRFADRPVDFYSVTYETPAKIRSVLEHQPLITAIGFDNDLATFKAFQAWGIPAIFDPEGIVVSALHPNHLTETVLETALAGDIPDVEQTRGWPDPEGAEEHFRSLLEADGR